MRFAPDHFLFGGTCRSVWALRSYPASTQTQALLSHLGERPGVTIHIYLRHVAGQEEGKLLSNAANRGRLVLCQQRGFQAVQPWGRNVSDSQFERVLPLSSAANLYPLHYSGRTDPHGFYLGRDRFGSNVIVDLDRRTEDRTNGHALVLGNSGQGKSFLIKLLVCNILESGKTVVCLDAENEYADLAESLDGCFMDMGGGATIINPLEPKSWEGGVSRLSRHISFLQNITDMRESFARLDEALEQVQGLTASGSGLDAISVKAAFFALCFGGPDLSPTAAASPVRSSTAAEATRHCPSTTSRIRIPRTPLIWRPMPSTPGRPSGGMCGGPSGRCSRSPCSRRSDANIPTEWRTRRISFGKSGWAAGRWAAWG